jgi:SAM-dependent methyltransferase
MIDIRPIELCLPNLSFIEGSILKLPFADNTIESLSSLCVVEHIGLGRYGDPLDPWGSENAVNELKRVLKPGGDLFFSVPVDRECLVYFNAHRAFTRDYILGLFDDLQLIEEKYIYGKVVRNDYDKASGFGTGLFHFRKLNHVH